MAKIDTLFMSKTAETADMQYTSVTRLRPKSFKTPHRERKMTFYDNCFVEFETVILLDLSEYRLVI